jgi:hypothetical protein
MISDPPSRDDRSRSHEPNRPVRLLSHARTAAMLCFVAIAFSLAHTISRDPTRVVWVELVLVAYGLIAAASCIAVGGLRRLDKVRLWIYGVVYLLTFAWAFLTPSLNVN